MKSAIAAIALAALPATAQEYRPVLANCKDGVLTLSFPQAVTWVKIEYHKILTLCTRTA
jgi:hypothetical protein